MKAQPYTVVGDGFLMGDYYKDGAAIRLNAKQAAPFLAEERLKAPAKSGAKAPAKPADTSKADAKD